MSLDLSPFRTADATQHLADLDTLFGQGRLAFLLGAGSSACAGLPLMTQLTDTVLKNLDGVPKAILKEIIKNFAGSSTCTIEDFMSELVDHIAIAERRQSRISSVSGAVLGKNTHTSDDLLQALNCIKKAIAEAINQPGHRRDVHTHRQFVRTIHRTLRPPKNVQLTDGVDYFTLNYDTLLEDALAIERVSIADGFRGGATGWWDISHYDTIPTEARIYKLHGSIDWCLCDDDPLPRRVREGISVPNKQDHLLIWPAATKYQETQRDPYAQLVSRMRRCLRPMSKTQVVLCICGYSYGDSHINAEIERAMYDAGDSLTVVAFTHENEPGATLTRWRSDPRLRERLIVFANRGHYHSRRTNLYDRDMPWWRFEVLTELMAGSR